MKIKGIEVNRKNFTTSAGYCGDCISFEWSTARKSCGREWRDDKYTKCVMLNGQECPYFRKGK